MEAAQKLLGETDKLGNTPLHLAFFAQGVAIRNQDQSKKAALGDLIGQMKQWIPSAESIRNNGDLTPGGMRALGVRGSSDYEEVLNKKNL